MYDLFITAIYFLQNVNQQSSEMKKPSEKKRNKQPSTYVLKNKLVVA